jgi:hypothetical protein
MALVEHLPEPIGDETPSQWRAVARAELAEYLAVVEDPGWRLVMNLVPHVGGFLAEYHAQWTGRRLERQARMVGELTEAGAPGVDELGAMLEADQMLRSCMDVALEAAGHAATDAQLQLLRRVMRRAIDSEVRADVAYYQLSTIRELTPAHLDVLRIVDRRQVVDPPTFEEREAEAPAYWRYRDDDDARRDWTTDTADIVSEYPGIEPILDSVMAGLVRLGLIEPLRLHGFEEETEKFVRTRFAAHLLAMLRDDPPSM